jgi:Flp pilus assembly pilin Flp
MKKILFLCLFPLLSIAQTQIGVDINGEATDDNFGRRVSISSDGNTIAIGAYLNDGNGIDSGQARVYQNTAGTWTQIGNDIDGTLVNDQSGESVCISGDASTLAIGSVNHNSYSGQVRVYKNTLGNWTQIGTDINGEAAGDNFGSSISLSTDGNKIAIGANLNDANGSNSGNVRVFQYITGVWTQIGTSINGEAADDLSGYSVALSSDGSIVAIGAYRNDGNGVNSGHVRVYQNTVGAWTQIGNDINGEAADDQSGNVSLSANGYTVAIGAYGNDGNGLSSGQVRVYQNSSGTWIQIGNDIDGEVAGDQSGYSVSISGDGNIVAIGAFGNDGNGLNSGNVRIFKNITGVWTQIGTNINGEATVDMSGWNVSLSSDGKTVIIGAPGNDGNGANSGHVRVFDLSALLASDSFVLNRFSIYPNPVSEMLNISLQDNLTLEKVNIYNTLGQLIKTEKQNKINVSTFAKGSYFVEIITPKGKATKTILVE